MKIVVKNKNITIAENAYEARSFKDRVMGLMFSQDILKGDGLLIKPCNSIHTFFMRYPIDTIFISKTNKILKIYKNLKPWRVTPMVWGASSVLELRGGVIPKTVVVGDELEVTDV